MPEHSEAYGAHPPQLLDDYLDRFRRAGRAALPGTAVRTRSLDARLLLARYALRDEAAPGELLAAARSGDTRWLTARRKRVTASAIADLARVMALQDMLPDDTGDALALYDLVFDALGARPMSSLHQGFHIQLAFLQRRPERARELLNRYPNVPPQVRAEVQLDLINPFVADRPVEPWLAGFGRLLPDPPVTVLPVAIPGQRPAGDDQTAHRAPAGSTAFDRLAAQTVEPADAPRLISVVVSAFRPDEGLITAVRSILAQTWSQVEVLVLDDASPPEYDGVLARCVALDPRVRLVKLPVNGGTYVARNVAMDIAAGEFLTFQDSDDWSHPRRLELQVRPMLADATVVATTSDGIGVTDDLLMTRSGVRSGRLNPSSLMLRREVVRMRLGYFDAIRKAADSEFIGRLRAAFGEAALHHVDGPPLALIRLSPNSLSRSEIRAYWMHPARVAYISAYRNWHAAIAARTADPYRPKEPASRPFAAPLHLRTIGGAPPAQDVVLAGDWTPYGPAQQSMMDEIRALTQRGVRVGVLHLEAYLPMLRRRQPLCRAVQDLINDGTVAQVQLTDDTSTSLLIVREPSVLQFAPGEAARLRTDQMIVLADQAPHLRDGSHWRYAPEVVTRAVRRIFGVAPQWCPQDAAVRAALRPYLEPGQFAAFDLPGVIDAHRWERAVPGRRGRRPVLGRDLRGRQVGWAQDRAALLATCPGGTSVDVRLRGSLRSPQSLLHKVGLPPSWLVYEESDVTARTFLHQLDFYVHFPPAESVEVFDRATLEALAVGCVVVLPHRFADTYADAAVYCEPREVPSVVRTYFTAPERYEKQSRRAQELARERFDPAAYADRIVALLGVRNGDRTTRVTEGVA